MAAQRLHQLKRKYMVPYNSDEDSDNPLIISNPERNLISPAASIFLQSINKAQEQSTFTPTKSIKEALTVGSWYTVMEIRQISTKFGKKQLWVVKEVDTGEKSKIYSCNALNKHTSDPDGEIDPEKVALMQELRILYNGFTTVAGGAGHYSFSFSS